MPAGDANFEEFVSNWPRFKERLVVFLGAGASIGARNVNGDNLPNAYDLRNNLWQEFKHSGPKPFDPAELKLMTLEHAAAIIEMGSGREEMNRYLIRHFTCDKPMWQHLALPHLNPLSIFTTNYDELVELGYKHHPTVPDLICDGREPVPGRSVIFKPHGSLGHSNQPIGQGDLVITQFDYFSMIAEYRKMLRNAMQRMKEQCVIIAGYSFGDMDIGAELFQIRRDNTGTPWYAVFPRDDAQVRKMYAQRLNIQQINMDLETFLVRLDAKVGFISDDHKHKRKNALKSRGVIQ